MSGSRGGRDVPLGLISFIFMQFWQTVLPPATKSFCSRGVGGQGWSLSGGGGFSSPYGKVRAIHPTGMHSCVR